MFTITITTPSLDVLTKLADAIRVTAPAVETSAPKGKITVEEAAKAVAPKAAEVVPGFLGKVKKEAAPVIAEEDLKALFEKVKETTSALVKKDKVKGRELAVATLMQYGAAKASDLNPKDYEAYLAAATAALEKLKPAEKPAEDLV